MEANFASEKIDPIQDITHYRYPVGLAKVDDMTCSMSGCMDDTKSSYFVALMQDSLDWISRSSKRKLDELSGNIAGSHPNTSLHTGDIRFVTGEWDASGFADVLDCPLMIGMTMRQCY